jgi:hypothetical protein
MEPTGDAALALAAAEKRRRGEKPSREETAALRRVQRAREEQLRQTHFAAVRKGEWQRWSGRQQKVLNEQAARYGIPIGEAVINLPDVVRWLHDFIAENAQKLRQDDEPPDGAALERLRLAKAELAEILLSRERQDVVSRKDLRDGHTRIGGILRICGEALLRQFGPGAQQILNNALDDAQREVDRLFPADGTAPAA